MASQLINIILPEGRADDIFELLHDQLILDSWQDHLEDNKARIHLLVASNEVEEILNILETYLQPLPNSHALLLPVEALIPTPQTKQKNDDTDEGELKEDKKTIRVSRQELYNDINVGADLTSNYVIMVFLSAIIAAIGLVRNDMAIIIGAMVLAPLLLPNVAFALANTLGDSELAYNAAKTAFIGLAITILVGIVIGLFYSVDPNATAMASRTQVTWADFILALASGSAGVLALTGGGRISLVGVMVAVALVPPLVTGGLMMGAGFYRHGCGAFTLAIINIICINLAGIITFYLQGIRPSTWWEKNKAVKASQRATIILLALLILLIVIVLMIPNFPT